MTRCPHCGEVSNEKVLPLPAHHHAQTTHKRCLTVTKCCGKPVMVYVICRFELAAYTGKANVDDWGKSWST